MSYLEVCPWKALCNVDLFSPTFLCFQVSDEIPSSVSCSYNNGHHRPKPVVLPGRELWECWAFFHKWLVSAVLVVMWNSLPNIFGQDACAQILFLLSVCFCSMLRTPALLASLLKLQKPWFSPVPGELDSPFKKISGKLFFLYSLYCICLLLLLLVVGTKRKVERLLQKGYNFSRWPQSHLILFGMIAFL